MMAPVVVKGQKERDVFIPEGNWQHLFTGEKFTGEPGGTQTKIKCPFGTPVALKRIDTEEQLDIDFSKGI